MGRLRGIGRSGTIGVDIDRGSIKAVQLQGSGAGYVLQHVGYHRLPHGAIIDGEVADQNLLAAELREFWDSHSFKGRSIVFGVSTQREMISRYTSAVRAGGLRPEGVDVKALSLTRSTLPDPFFGEDGAVLLLDVGTEITNLVVADRGNPVLTRFVPVGLGDFVAAVMELADLSEDEAERQALDPRVRLGSEQDEETDPEEENFDPALVYDVRRGLEGAARTLPDEVQRSIEHHRSQEAARDVSRVLLSGEAALIPGLDGYLGDLLGVPTSRGKPVDKLSANRSNIEDAQLRAMEPVLAVAFGLAMEDE